MKKLILLSVALILSNSAFANTYRCEMKNSGNPSSWPADFLKAETSAAWVSSIDYIYHLPKSDGTFDLDSENIFRTNFRFGYEVTNCSANLNYVSEATGLVKMSSLCLIKGSKNKLKYDVNISPHQEGSAILELREDNSDDIVTRTISVLPCKVETK